MTLNIRTAVPDDMATVHMMLSLLARHHGDEAKISIAELNRQTFDLRKGRILVAAEEQELLGYALLLAFPNMVTGKSRFEVEHVFVMEWRRRIGIGRALINAARVIAQSEGAECLRIGTHADNFGAQQAYRDMGFVQMPQAGPRFNIPLD